MSYETFAHSIDGHTRLLGVIGDPIHHSLSPAMHNLAYAELGLNYRYLPFHVRPQDLADAVHGLRAIGAIGFNATIPHKEKLLPLMDEVDPMAQMIGAVNTVRIGADGRMQGYNTDVYGFKTALRDSFFLPLESLSIVVLGAGGAARGVLMGLLQLGAKHIFLVNRTFSRAEGLAEQCTLLFPDAVITPLEWNPETLPLAQCELLINTTSLGLKDGDALPLDLSCMPAQGFVYDIIYSPVVTPLMAAASLQGLSTENGLGMLIHQGARAFEIWTGVKMPVTKVKAKLLSILS
ncbi:MAG: shikimate dehydrogenase [Magnetococcus sp. YQC-5]